MATIAIKEAGQKQGSPERLEDLLDLELVSLLASTMRAVHVLSSMADAAHDFRLRQALRRMTVEAMIHAEQLVSLLADRDDLPAPVDCNVMATVVKDLSNVIASSEDTAMRDLRLVSALQRIKHMTIASAGTAAAHAQQVDQHGVATILQQVVDDERRSDRELTRLCGAIAEGPDRAFRPEDFELDLIYFFQRRIDMNDDSRRYRDNDSRRDEGRSWGGRRSAALQDRDEEGRFAGYRGDSDRQHESGRYGSGWRNSEEESYGRGRSEYGSRRNDESEYAGYRGGSGRSGRAEFQYDDGGDRGYSGSAEQAWSREREQGRYGRGERGMYEGSQGSEQGGYGRSGYGQGGYGQGSSNQGYDNQGNWGRGSSGQRSRQSSYSQGSYSQGSYGQGGYEQGGWGQEREGNYGGGQGCGSYRGGDAGSRYDTREDYRGQYGSSDWDSRQGGGSMSGREYGESSRSQGWSRDERDDDRGWSEGRSGGRRGGSQFESQDRGGYGQSYGGGSQSQRSRYEDDDRGEWASGRERDEDRYGSRRGQHYYSQSRRD